MAGNNAHDADGHDEHLAHREPSVIDTHDRELIRDRENEIDDAKVVDDPTKHVPRTGAISPWRAALEAVPLPHVYHLNLFGAIVAGSIASALFLALWYPMYFYYRSSCLDLFGVFGSFVVPGEVGGLTRLVGFVLSMGFGVSLAVTYAIILLFLRTQSKGVKGIFFGFGLHVGLMAFGLPIAVGLAPFFAAHAHFDQPDMVLQRVGHGSEDWTPATLALFAHIAFGAIVGSFYRHKVVLMEEDLP